MSNGMIIFMMVGVSIATMIIDYYIYKMVIKRKQRNLFDNLTGMMDDNEMFKRGYQKGLQTGETIGIERGRIVERREQHREALSILNKLEVDDE
jgi:hypothetical protein